MVRHGGYALRCERIEYTKLLFHLGEERDRKNLMEREVSLKTWQNGGEAP